MSYGTPFTATLPVVSTTAGPAYATLINAWMTEAQAKLEAKVTQADMAIGGTLEMNFHTLSEISTLKFQEQVGLLVGVNTQNSLWCYADELYFTDGAGNNIQVTASGGLNFVVAGGIGGDYGSDPAAAVYTASASAFVLTQDPGVPSKLHTGDILLRETVAGANAITIKSPASIAGAINRTLLGANPASTSVLMVSSAGVESASRELSIDDLTLSDDLIVGGTASIAEDDVKHSERVTSISAAAGSSPDATFHDDGYWISNAVSQSVDIALPLADGERIKAVLMYGRANGSSAWSFELWKLDLTARTKSQVGSTQTSGTAATGEAAAITGLTETVAQGYTYFARWNSGGTGSTHSFHGIEMTVDRV